jgi:hypothetical protein
MWEACSNTRSNGSPRGCIFVRLAASITDREPALRERLREIFTEWAGMLGRGEPDWDGMASVHGRLFLSLTIGEPEAATV